MLANPKAGTRSFPHKEYRLSMKGKSSVRALERGLDIIRLLNVHNGLTVTQVGELTELPRPTAFRLLRTLEGLDYLFRDTFDKKYRLTAHVRSLSNGYDEEEWLPKVSRPIMEELCRKILWPAALGTINGPSILIRDTTDELSPYSVRRHSSGFNIPLLSTASGRVFLAYAEQTLRTSLIETALRQDPKALTRGGANLEIFYNSLMQIKKDGYCCMKIIEQNHNSLALPVVIHGKIFATLSVRFYISAMSLNQAVEKYHDTMRAAAKKIGYGIENWQRSLIDIKATA